MMWFEGQVRSAESAGKTVVWRVNFGWLDEAVRSFGRFAPQDDSAPQGVGGWELPQIASVMKSGRGFGRWQLDRRRGPGSVRVPAFVAGIWTSIFIASRTRIESPA